MPRVQASWGAPPAPHRRVPGEWPDPRLPGSGRRGDRPRGGQRARGPNRVRDLHANCGTAARRDPCTPPQCRAIL